MFSGGSLLNVHAFMRTHHLDFFDATINFLTSHIALLCLLVRMTCMWWCLHFRSMCSHVLGSEVLHMGHVIGGKATMPKNNCFLAFPMY